MNIYIKNPNTSSLIEFIKSMINKRYACIENTYHDEECTNLQCGMGTNRSTGDLFDLAKTYFPKLKIHEFYLTFLRVRIIRTYNPSTDDEKIKYFLPYIMYCDDIYKFVHYFTNYRGENDISDSYIQAKDALTVYNDEEYRDESKYIPIEILNDSGINSTSDWKKYVKKHGFIDLYLT